MRPIRRRTRVGLAVILLMTLTGFGSLWLVLYKDRTYVESEPFVRSGADAARALVVYYSRSGNTEGAAREAARHFDADLVQIHAPAYPRSYVGWRAAAADANREATRTEIEHSPVDLSRYELVVLASPIWLFRPAVPLWAFVEESQFEGANVILLNTGNSRFEESHVDRFERLVEEHGGNFVHHIFIRRGRVYWQKSPDEVREEVRRELESRDQPL